MTGPASEYKERKEKALTMWADGRTATEIAREVPFSADQIHHMVSDARKAGDSRAILHPTGSPSEWSEPVLARLRALWAGGLSCSQIAAALGHGISKNAVIGKVHRLKLPARREASSRVARRARPALGRVGEIQKARERARSVPRDSQPPVQKMPVAVEFLKPRPDTLEMVNLPSATPSRNIALLDLAVHDCRYIPGEPVDGFCGHPKWNGLPYCEHHARLCYQPGSSLLGLKKASDARRRRSEMKVSKYVGAFA